MRNRCLLMLLFIMHISFSVSFPFSSLITNVMNNKWFMPAVVVTSLVASNALNYWYMKQQVVSAVAETDAAKDQLHKEKDAYIKIQSEWIELLHAKGVNAEVIKQSDQSHDAIKFTNVSQDNLIHLVNEIQKAGFTHSEEKGYYVNMRALELEKQLEEAVRQKAEADAINKATLQIEKEAIKLLQEEVFKLNGDINQIKTLFKTITTCTIVIKDDHNPNVLTSAFASLERPLTKNNDNNAPYEYFYNDPTTNKRKFTIMLESQKPLPPGVMSPPTQRHIQNKG